MGDGTEPDQLHEAVGDAISKAAREQREAQALVPKMRRAVATEVTRIVNTLMVRQPRVRTAPRKSAVLTALDEDAVRAYAARNPRAHIADIARKFKVNPGRVSEVLNGKKRRSKKVKANG